MDGFSLRSGAAGGELAFVGGWSLDPLFRFAVICLQLGYRHLAPQVKTHLPRVAQEKTRNL